MKSIHKTSGDKMASLASKVLKDHKSSRNAKSLAGSVLSQHEKSNEEDEMRDSKE